MGCVTPQASAARPKWRSLARAMNISSLSIIARNPRSDPPCRNAPQALAACCLGALPYLWRMRRFIPFLPKPACCPGDPPCAAPSAPAPAALNDAGAGPADRTAFKGKPAAVALLINSPGGSAVQSSLIAARIRRLADEKSVPVHAFVEDVAASGGYWLACAADEIWVDRQLASSARSA